MNRKQFMQSIGATCNNWQWSWSFINEAESIIIFGHWDIHKDGLIFSEEWKGNASNQSREHIRLIEEDSFRLATFLMVRGTKKNGKAYKKRIEPYLTFKKLKNVGTNWYAENDTGVQYPPEEVRSPEQYMEGATSKVSVNIYERNSRARKKCLEHYGYDCQVCDLNFETIYGVIGRRFIHVHHEIPLSLIRRSYKLDPIKDLKPVCPNCHAMLHKYHPPMEIRDLKATILAQKK